jgi:hypothetical protein
MSLRFIKEPPKRDFTPQFWVSVACAVANLLIFVFGPEDTQGFSLCAAFICAVGAAACLLAEAQ